MTPYLDPELLKQPGIIAQILASLLQPAAQYDPKAISGLVNTPSNWAPPANPPGYPLIQPQSARNPGLPINPMQPYPAGTVAPQLPITAPVAQVGIVPPPQGVAPLAQPASPTSNLPNGLEGYMQYFKNTLAAAPELDTKKRNQLATVAAINALGSALKNVVDLHSGSKHGSPINLRQDTVTPALLAQYEKEGSDYQQRKDRYDLMKTQSMQEAFKYAYGDKNSRQSYEDQLALLGQQNTYMTGRETQQATNDLAKLGEANKLSTTRDATLQGYDLEKIKKNYENEQVLIGMRNQDALNMMKERYGMQNAAKTAMALAKKSVQVVDVDPNKPVTIPPQIYMDILQKQTAIQNIDFAEFLNATDFNVQNNAGDIMVARYWKDFYEPVYGANDSVVSWKSKGVQYGTPSQQGTPPVPGSATDTVPSIFIPKPK